MNKTIVYSLIGLFLLLPAVSSAATFNNSLFYGITNSSDVTALQEFLTVQGDYSGPITGNFYSLTLVGVKAFQIQSGIQPASGYFGILSRGVANQLLQSIAPIEETGTTTQSLPPQTSVLGGTQPISPVNPTPTQTPVIQSTVVDTALLTDIFEISHGTFRVESNKPLDFPNTVFSGNVTMVPQGTVQESTGWFWVTPQNHQVFPSFYYEGVLNGIEGNTTITITALDGTTLTRTLNQSSNTVYSSY